MPPIPSIPSYALPGVEDLPASAASWKVDPERAVLLIHDMQRYFLEPFEDSQRTTLIGNCARLKDQSEARGVPVLYTAQPGRMASHDRGLLMDMWGPGMSTDPYDREIVPELAPPDSANVLTKWRYSAFYRSDLLERMRALKRDQLVVCGIYAHVGVLVTAIDAFTHDIETFLVADAVGDFSREFHDQATRYAATRCAVVLPHSEVF